MSHWWLQDCRSDAYLPGEGRDEEEQAVAASKSAQVPAFDASPQVTQSFKYDNSPNLTVLFNFNGLILNNNCEHRKVSRVFTVASWVCFACFACFADPTFLIAG